MTEVRFRCVDNSGFLTGDRLSGAVRRNMDVLSAARKGGSCYEENLGWLKVSEWAGEEWLEEYERMASEVRKDADAFVVIGVGGSNQAARAVYEALEKKASVKLFWVGNTISPYSLNAVLDELKDRKSIYIDCIAKNFETLEPGIAFRAMRDLLVSRYGQSYPERVFCTFTEGSRSWTLAEKHGFRLLPFPGNVGGRYSALTPVGLFPLAVAGLDIRALARGACHMMKRLWTEDEDNIALQYAAARTLLAREGKSVELLCCFEPRWYRFAKWWKQLFGESEGKDGKGLLPMDASYSEDLHSLGQFVQDGSPVLFETFLDVQKQDSSYVIRENGVDDGFGYLNGKDYWDINKAAFRATVEAHSKRFACLILEVPALDEETFGQLFYFFEFACCLSCGITGVNPFNQEGVEDYKRAMSGSLGKTTGLEGRKA